jgi:integrase
MGEGLSVKKVEALLRQGKPGRHTDVGGVKGLMLCIENERSAHWLLRWQRDGHVRHMGLGSAADLGLAAAREVAREQRERIARGVDPLELRRRDKQAQREAEARLMTFREASKRCHEALAAGWTSTHHATEFIASLERYAFPIIGNLDVAAVDKNAVLSVLEQKLRDRMGKAEAGGVLWVRKTITADRVRNRIERVLDWAEARGYRASGTPNPARWKGFLDVLLPKPRKVAPVQHMRSAPYSEVPALMQVLAADQTPAAHCLRFIVMTACRLGEALGGRWDEVNLEAAEWVIPASRMKGRKPHTVPLAPPASQVIRGLCEQEDNPHLFAGRDPGTHLAANTLTETLRRAGCDATIHGFRSSFRDWAEECSTFPSIVAELALAHSPGSAVVKAYRRTDLVAKRRKLMEAWATFCTTPPAEGTVLPMRRPA